MEKKSWISNFFMTEKGEIYIVKPETGGLCLVSEVIITFFTGIKDSNGTKIFEDDIVRMNNIIGVVKYIAPCFVLATRNGFYPLGSANEKEIEVIGNIYEHPERFFENRKIDKPLTVIY